MGPTRRERDRSLRAMLAAAAAMTITFAPASAATAHETPAGSEQFNGKAEALAAGDPAGSAPVHPAPSLAYLDGKEID